MIYAFITPSDTITIEAPNDRLAALFALDMGNGKAGCRREDGKDIHTMIAFGGRIAQGLYGLLRDLEFPELPAEYPGEAATLSLYQGYVEAVLPDLATVFESIMYCSVSERKALEVAFEGLAPEDKLARLAKFNDEKRTSLSDYGKYAHQMAAAMRKRYADKSATVAPPDQRPQPIVLV